MGEARRECLDLVLISALWFLSMGTAEKALPRSLQPFPMHFPFSSSSSACVDARSQDAVQKERPGCQRSPSQIQKTLRCCMQ